MSTPTRPAVDGTVVPVPTPGTELLGRYQGSGFQTPRYLARRADGQVAQLPDLLYRVLTRIDGHRDVATIAADEDLSIEQVAMLVDDRLAPAGLASPARTAAPAAAGRNPSRRDHLLMLRLRTAVVPERLSWRIGGVFAPLFRPLVVTTLLAAFAAVDVAIAVLHGWAGLVDGAHTLVARPEWTLAVLGFLLVAGVLHECGHVGACRYGGAVPGSMGVGIYIVWPAFYSTVTDAYRLSRGGRLRTDLGGVHLNAVVLAVAGAAYLATGKPWLLAAVALLHAETAWQFLPSLRLDGYYILADLVGVPDLFSRMRPILRGLVRRGPPEPAVADLKPWVRRVVTAWVVLVVPFLLYWVVLFVVLAPTLAPAAWHSLQGLAASLSAALADGAIGTAVLDAARILLLVLPWAGGLFLVATRLRRLARTLARLAVRAVRAQRRRADPGRA